MKKCMVLVIAVFLGMSTAALADAVDGNVYNVAYFPKPLRSADNTGNFGYINIQLTSGPSCTGSMLAGSANFCTIDANANMCDPTYRYTEAGILALYDQLRPRADQRRPSQVVHVRSRPDPRTVREVPGPVRPVPLAS